MILDKMYNVSKSRLSKKEFNSLYQRLQANPNITEGLPTGITQIILWSFKPKFVNGIVPLLDLQKALGSLKIPKDYSKGIYEAQSTDEILDIFISMPWLADEQKILILNALNNMIEILTTTDRFKDRSLTEFFDFAFKDEKGIQDTIKSQVSSVVAFNLDSVGWSTIAVEYFLPENARPKETKELQEKKKQKKQIENIAKELYLNGFCDKFAEQLIKHNIVIDKAFLSSLNVSLSVSQTGDGENSRTIIKANYF